jgi:hypothetical protein
MFKFKSGYFTNIKNGKVVSIKDRKDEEGNAVWASVRIGGRHGHPSQRWRISYLHLKDARDTYTKKGSMSKRGFGFLANEPFYLRSKLPMQRVAECVGANNIVLKKWALNRKAQQFQFNPITKAIHGMYWTSYVFSQEGTNLRCRTVNSRWF